jgi:hypothetical protein
VPYGQPSAAAGDATASDPKAVATVQQVIRIPRFTVQTLVRRACDFLGGLQC